MAKTERSLSTAISEADDQMSVLDDRIDVEDHAAFIWLKAHSLPGDVHHRVVIGKEVLPASWVKRAKRFTDALSAEAYLRRFEQNHRAMRVLQSLAESISFSCFLPRAHHQILATVAGSLASGRLWLIELPKRIPLTHFLSKTDPAAFAPLNPRYGTKIDFAYIAKLEGDQYLRGYVPFKGNTGIVAGKSGMTVASGFDVGQWEFDDLKSYGLPAALLEKIKPFTAPNNFKGLNKAQVAATVGKLGPVPILTKTEADICDGTIFGVILGKAIQAWDAGRGKDVPKFVSLPGGWQTVWLSRNYQGKTGTFGVLAKAGKWEQAVAALRADTEYGIRTNQEADLLEEEFPVAPPPPGKVDGKK